MIHPLKIANTLADETRFSIYEKLLQTKKNYSVQQIAELFTIHPNVARLHLTKLTEVELIQAEYEKTGKGGRPGRVYRYTNKPIPLPYAQQENTKLVRWILMLINGLDEETLQLAKEIAYQDGLNEMTTIVKQNNVKTMEQKLSILSLKSSLIGYIPKIEQVNHSTHIYFTIYNCPFSEYIPNHPSFICTLHEANLKGQVDALFGPNHFLQFNQINGFCEFCEYKIMAINDKEN